MPFLIMFGIVLSCHLSLDKSFSQEMRTSATAVFILIGILYVIFGLIF